MSDSDDLKQELSSATAKSLFQLVDSDYDKQSHHN